MYNHHTVLFQDLVLISGQLELKASVMMSLSVLTLCSNSILYVFRILLYILGRLMLSVLLNCSQLGFLGFLLDILSLTSALSSNQIILWSDMEGSND